MTTVAEEPILSLVLKAEPPLIVEPAKEDIAPPKPTAEAKKVTATRKCSASTHPSYFEMVKDAIVTLKERTGSSQYAITKFIEEKQKNLPPNFRKLLLVQLRKLVANGKLTTVKHSYKLPPVKKSAPSKPKAKPVTKAKPAVKSKSVVKTKAVTQVKAKAAGKRKAPEKPKTEKKPAKALRTSTGSTPSKAKKSVGAAKRTPAKVKTAKKTPTKKSAPMNGKK